MTSRPSTNLLIDETIEFICYYNLFPNVLRSRRNWKNVIALQLKTVTLYQQIDEVSMGIPPAPLFANFFSVISWS